MTQPKFPDLQPPSTADMPGAGMSKMVVPGAGEIEVPSFFLAPSGPGGPVLDGRQDSLIPLSDPSVLCNNCAFSFIIKGPAAIANRRPDGTPFEMTSGLCTRVQPPMSLDEIRPTSCNSFMDKNRTIRCRPKQKRVKKETT